MENLKNEKPIYVNAKQAAILLKTSRQNINLLMLKKHLTPMATPESLYYFTLKEVLEYREKSRKK
jgi:hypothetical protein